MEGTELKPIRVYTCRLEKSRSKWVDGQLGIV